ncbi:MAG: selenocysteine-specific translation elongation factor [Bacillota bacterium]|nr:selenocysteine-specific translation elongation factor [Bacillota bacterium]
MDDLIIGTAGHVDHGKTVLIKALTGVDTDRLREEKERGISIDLGFAPFRLPGGRLAGVVDVPGHERFIHNMLAGAAGMDLVMLVVDAAEGIMPQTREHLDILQLLGIKNGIVVITKIDLVDEEWRELVEEEIREELRGTFLEEAPVHSVSAVEGRGIAELKELIDHQTANLEPRSEAGPLRLPVDRSFSIAGFGTVVTGTLIQGKVEVGDRVEVVPPGLEARVRNIQVHDEDVKRARAGTRVALNLSGLEKSSIVRGSVVSNPGYYRETALLDVSLSLLPRAARRLKNLDPVHFFLGTARTAARVLLLDRDELHQGETALAQCRLEKPIVAERGDPFVIRSYSPMTTIGGGKVLDPHPARHHRFRPAVIKKLQELEDAADSAGEAPFLRHKLEEMLIANAVRLAREARLDLEKTVQLLEEMVSRGEMEKLGEAYILSAELERHRQKLLAELDKYHQNHPLSPGISRARLKGFLPSSFGQREYDSFLKNLQERKEISAEDDLVSEYGFKPAPSPEEQKRIDTLVDLYRSGRLQPPSVREAFAGASVKSERWDEYLRYLQMTGTLVKINEELYYHADSYREALALLKRHFAANDKITLAEFRDLTGSSRKYAQALLEHFDQKKYTRRIEDYRVPMRLKNIDA